MTELPAKLDKTPLVDAIFEIRFEPSLEAVGDLLPGMLYAAYEGRYSEIESLPLSRMPRDLRKQDERLTYSAHNQLAGKRNILRIGDRVVILSIIWPYPGWQGFVDDILDLLKKLQETKLIKSPNRFSLRYINVIETKTDNQLSLLNTKIEVAGGPVSEKGFQLRLEKHTDDFLTIVKIVPNTVAKIEEVSERGGILIDIDTIQEISENSFWDNTKEQLNACHTVLKEHFFSLLLPKTLKSLGPGYEPIGTTK
jgi:uncharacterized protein (TIGR04255 family)